MPPESTPTLAERLRALFRRLGAMTYDTLLLAGLLLVPTVLIVAARGGEPVPPGHPAYQSLLTLLVCGFYVLSWTRRRQTLGMRAWQLEVCHIDGRSLGVGAALARLVASLLSLAPAGAGYLWILIDRDGLAWHDRLTGTRVRFSANL
ncbi:MAG: RDD family protein [Pseudomonadota bacterium]